MSDIEDVDAPVVPKAPHRARRGRRMTVALASAGVGAVMIVAATLGLSALASGSDAALANDAQTGLIEEPPTEAATTVAKKVAAVQPAIEPTDATPTDATPTDTAEAGPAEAGPAEAGPAEAGPTAADSAAPEPPRYDAATDIASIPRPANMSASELANAEVWLKQQEIIADCMLDKGFGYVFTPWWTWPPKYKPVNENWDADPNSPKNVALDGAPDRGLGDDYDWREAGCIGYAVHVTGMDDAN